MAQHGTSLGIAQGEQQRAGAVLAGEVVEPAGDAQRALLPGGVALHIRHGHLVLGLQVEVADGPVPDGLYAGSVAMAP